MIPFPKPENSHTPPPHRGLASRRTARIVLVAAILALLAASLANPLLNRLLARITSQTELTIQYAQFAGPLHVRFFNTTFSNQTFSAVAPQIDIRFSPLALTTGTLHSLEIPSFTLALNPATPESTQPQRDTTLPSIPISIQYIALSGAILGPRPLPTTLTLNLAGSLYKNNGATLTGSMECGSGCSDAQSFRLESDLRLTPDAAKAHVHATLEPHTRDQQTNLHADRLELHANLFTPNTALNNATGSISWLTQAAVIGPKTGIHFRVAQATGTITLRPAPITTWDLDAQIDQVQVAGAGIDDAGVESISITGSTTQSQARIHATARAPFLSTPFELDVALSPHAYFAHATATLTNGPAWQSERPIRLARAGDLDITVTGSVNRLAPQQLILTASDLSLLRGEAQMHVQSPRIVLTDNTTITEPIALVTCAHITAGRLQLLNGELALRLPAGGTPWIEELRAELAGGRIAIQGIPLDPAGNVRGVLLCTDVPLASIVTLCGGKDVSGEGTVGGVVPFALKAGRLFTTGGMLQTDPTATGRLRVGNAAALSSVIPGYGLVIEETLRDMFCDAAICRINADNNVVSLALNIQGRPARDLPVNFDTKTRLFVRTTGPGNADFSKGIDLTLRLNQINIDDMLFGASFLDPLQQPR